MKKIPKTITVRWLKDHGACDDALTLFQKLFGRSTPLTIKTIRRFIRAAGSANGRDWRNWLAGRILDHEISCGICGGSGHKVYAAIRKANG
jgi:hypothetical protein